jgi:hypothetical protein
MRERERNLHKFRFNAYSQNGEDGVIVEILKRSFRNKQINTVEFGSGDIEKNSNTFNLIKNNKINNAVFIEADLNTFIKLDKLKNKYPEIVPINATVEFQKNSQSTIDNILIKNNIINDIDIMSIDIDSYDLDVFKSIEIYHPKLLIIEGGRQKYKILSEHLIDKNLNSFSSIFNEVSKKYYLIFYNGNLFFLNKNFFSKKHILLNYFIDDELHYLLHCLYCNYFKYGFLKKKIINLLSKNKYILKLLINYK